MALDYYTSGLVGGVLNGSYSPLFDIYSSPKLLTQVVLDILKHEEDKLYKREVVKIKHFGIEFKDFRKLRFSLKKAYKFIGHHSSWKRVGELDDILDSKSEEILPPGCQIKQVVKIINKDVSVNQNLFDQLDDKQKDIFLLHEALYYIGRNKYKHTSSFLTRHLIRSLLRRGANSADIEVFDALQRFIKNDPPKYYADIKENIPGSSKFNNWRLNLFDLAGKFSLKDSSEMDCPKEIENVVKKDLSFSLMLNTNYEFESTNPDQIGFYIQDWLYKSFASTDLSLSENDRFIKLGYRLYGGLDRKGRFFIFIPHFFSDSRYCSYERQF